MAVYETGGTEMEAKLLSDVIISVLEDETGYSIANISGRDFGVTTTGFGKGEEGFITQDAGRGLLSFLEADFGGGVL